MKTKIIIAPKQYKIQAGEEFSLRLEQGTFASLREQGLISRAQYEECLAICVRKHRKSGDVGEW